MADDYDFDNEFDAEDFDSPAKNTKQKNTKENDPYFKRKQSFGIKDKNDDDGFEPFDMEDIKDEDYSKPKTKPKDKPVEIKPKVEPKEEKSSMSKKKDDYEFVDDFEVEEKQAKVNKNQKINTSSNQSPPKLDNQTFMSNTCKCCLIKQS